MTSVQGGPAATAVRPNRLPSLEPNWIERALALAAGVLLVFVIAALIRGRAHWAQASPLIWLHLATVIVALTLTPALMLRTRGNPAHRWLGRVWVVSMIATAALSFGIRLLGNGRLSPIHLLSAFVLLMVPRLWWSARRHQVAKHRRSVQLMVGGALLVAGVFTFPFGRMLGVWLFR